MSIYHLSMSMVGGTKSIRSAVAAAAYQAGEHLHNQRTGLDHDFSHKRGVRWQEVICPDHVPELTRAELWNSVELAASSKNSRYAREIIIALPVELTEEQQLECVRAYVTENFVSKGMYADIALHDRERGSPNPHAHILLTVRECDEHGNWKSKSKNVFANDRDESGKPIYNPDKPYYDTTNAETKAATQQYRLPVLNSTGQQKYRERPGKGREFLWEKVKIELNDWDSRDNVELWRASWAEQCNRYLDSEHQLDHRSYERQGVDKIATMHIGKVSPELAEERRAYNAKAREYNHLTDQIQQLQVKQNEVGQDIIRQAEQEVSRCTERAESLLRTGMKPAEIEQTRMNLGYLKDLVKSLKMALNTPQRHRGEARELFSRITEAFRRVQQWLDRKELRMSEQVLWEMEDKRTELRQRFSGVRQYLEKEDIQLLNTLFAELDSLLEMASSGIKNGVNIRSFINAANKVIEKIEALLYPLGDFAGQRVRQYEARYEELKDTLYRMNLTSKEQAQLRAQTMELKELFSTLRRIDVNNPPEQNFFNSIAVALELLEKAVENIKLERRNELAQTFGEPDWQTQKGVVKNAANRDEPDLAAILAAARSSLDDSRVDRGKSEASTKSAGADRAHREAERERHRAETRRAAERAEREAVQEFGQERDEDYGERE